MGLAQVRRRGVVKDQLLERRRADELLLALHMRRRLKCHRLLALLLAPERLAKFINVAQTRKSHHAVLVRDVISSLSFALHRAALDRQSALAPIVHLYH